jgi:hypothetical protein
MSERRADSPATDDLRALGDASSRDMPGVDRSIAAARALRGRAIRRLRASSAHAALAVLGFLIVPFSYDRITAHDVELVVSGPVTPSLAEAVTAGLREELGARDVTVTRTPSAGGDALRFAARVPARDGVNVEQDARALATALERGGHAARVTIVPRRTRTSGSLYAFAREQVIRVRGKGRSARQIEAEIRRRLEDEGLGDAKVSVTDDHGMRHIQIEGLGTGAGAPRTLGVRLDGAAGPRDSLAKPRIGRQ